MDYAALILSDVLILPTERENQGDLFFVLLALGCLIVFLYIGLQTAIEKKCLSAGLCVVGTVTVCALVLLLNIYAMVAVLLAALLLIAGFITWIFILAGVD